VIGCTGCEPYIFSNIHLSSLTLLPPTYLTVFHTIKLVVTLKPLSNLRVIASLRPLGGLRFIQEAKKPIQNVKKLILPLTQPTKELWY